MMVEEKAAPTVQEILDAARMLSGVCDGARTRDESGYNAVDGPTAKSILRAPNPTARQVRCLWNILRKYRGQLSGFGIEYDALVPPELPPRGESGQFTFQPHRVRLVWVDTQYGRQIAVVFAYDAAIVTALKARGKRWFDKEGKNSGGFKNAWIIPGDLDQIEDLVGRLGSLTPPVTAGLEPDVTAFMESERERRKSNFAMSRAETAELDVPTKLPLRPFQVAGVKWGNDHDGRFLVGDEPGLGKTCQALGWLMLHPEALPALIVAPSTLRLNWKAEIEKFTDFKTLIMTAKSSLKSFQDLGIDASSAPLPGYDLTVVNYDLFRAPEDEESKEAKKDITKPKKTTWTGFINGLPLSDFAQFKTVIWDEIHKCKDSKSQRSKCSRALAKEMKYRIGLTGTPIINRPIEIYHPVQLIRPEALPDYVTYGKRFCAGFQDRFGWNFSGSSNLEELDELLRSKSGMIRRTKAQVLTELPPKTRVTIPIMLEGRLKDYEKAAKPILEKLAKNKVEREDWRARMASMNDADRKKYQAEHAEEASRKNKLTGYMIDEIEKVKQAALNAKFDEAMKFLLDLAESCEKLLVFTTHHETTDRVLERFREEKVIVDSIDGRTPQAARDGIKNRFQDGDVQVLVCGIRAAGEGLTLTASHTVVKLEFDWNPATHVQAEDRVHRYSQTKAVTIYYLMALGTIETKIVQLIDSKREVGFAALGEGDRMLDEKGIMDSILDDLLEVKA